MIWVIVFIDSFLSEFPERNWNVDLLFSFTKTQGKLSTLSTLIYLKNVDNYTKIGKNEGNLFLLIGVTKANLFILS